MVFRGGCPKVHDGPQGGRGGQKIPKIGPHGLRMAPNKLIKQKTNNRIK